MENEAKKFFERAKNDSIKMRNLMPDAAGGFSAFFAKVMKDGAISLREKELIALGIAVAIQCKPCIRAHTQKCLAAGATKEQILEAASVSMVMAGGPAFTHVPEVIEALEALDAL